MTEPTVSTTGELDAVLGDICFKNTALDFKWRFEYQPVRVVLQGADSQDKLGWLVWVTFERPDTLTGITGRGRGRDEIVWQGTTVSGVVKTCWLLVELMLRHETMEGFRFQDARIFNPHNSVFDLKELQEKHEAKI